MKTWKRITSIFTLVTSVPFLILVFAILPSMLIVIAIAGGKDDESDEKYDLWNSVRDEVLYEEDLENRVSSWLLAYTFETLYGYHEENDRTRIKDFILDEMCLFCWKEYQDNEASVDRFLTLQEMLDKVKETVDEEIYYEYVHRIKNQFAFEPQEKGRYPFPLEDFSITSRYGHRTDPMSGEGDGFHRGIDLASSDMYAPIISIADGDVIMTNTWKSSLGNYIIIRYKDTTGTFYGVYGHLSGILVEIGDDVEQGEVIGFQGGKRRIDPNAGVSTGRHLHFEIREKAFSGASSIDPAGYIM